MSAGSQLFQDLLGVLSSKLSGLEDLRADLRDLLTHINKVTHTPAMTSQLHAAALSLHEQPAFWSCDHGCDWLTAVCALQLKELGELGGDGSDQSPSLDLAPHLHDSYKVQVIVHVTLTQLRSFCHDLTRSLRALATYRP